MHTQDNRIGAPEGVPTQEFVRRVYSEDFAGSGFAAPGFANRSSTNQGFTTEDILWALGIWSVIICLSPVILFYMLMVA